MVEKDLEIYDVWESPNKNLFIKINKDYSLAIGQKEYHQEEFEVEQLKITQYVKSNDITPVKRVGRIIFD